MSFVVYNDPFRGLAESIKTSNVLDARDAFDISVSIYITSGTSSVLSYQVSGSSVGPDSIAEASWSLWTNYIAPSGNSSNASVIEPPLSYPWHRILRPASGASFQINWNKQVYGP